MRYNNNNKEAIAVPQSLQNAVNEQNHIAVNIDLDSIDEQIYKGEKVVINDIGDPYNGQEEFENRYILRGIFDNKCAYCEKKEFKPDVEHYRPKKNVTNPNGNNHGYYWLCYNWSNLLPACNKCNSGNGKWDKFPVAGVREITPPLDENILVEEECLLNCDRLLNENPLLLNPEIDIPEEYLVVNWGGKLEGLDGDTGKGSTTISVCDLNRGNLIYGRKKIIDTITQNFTISFAVFRTSEDETDLIKLLRMHFENLDDKREMSEEYSFVPEYIFNHFDEFVDQHIEDLNEVEKTLLKQEFHNYNN